MIEQIQFVVNKIKDLNDDPAISMKYYTNTCPGRNITNKSEDTIKYDLLRYLFEHCHRPDILVELEVIYQNNQQFCWQSHSHHFHPTFEQYVNCPITCLGEIEEYLEKIVFKVLGA